MFQRTPQYSDLTPCIIVPCQRACYYTSRYNICNLETLVGLGYKQELRREFGLWTTFSVAFAVLALFPSLANTLYYVCAYAPSCFNSRPPPSHIGELMTFQGMGYAYAGTANMVWGFLIAAFFIQCVSMSIAELCSSRPTSGGLYYASAALAPRPYGPLAAWITRWSSWIALVTFAPAVDYGLAVMTLAAASINSPAYTPENVRFSG